jgi:alpha-N-acetylglucosaminidase
MPVSPTQPRQGWRRKTVLRFLNPARQPRIGAPFKCFGLSGIRADLWKLGLLVVCLLGGVTNLRADENSQPAESVLRRLLPYLYSQISLHIAPSSDGRDYFRLSGERGHITVEGNNNSALLYGVNWYLKYVAHLQISTNGSNLRCNGPLPTPQQVILKESPYRYRYALNQNVDGYTSPYWDGPRWQREIDLLALSGINALLIERGTDTVLYETFREFGYSDKEIRQWITQPAHQNWQLMGNLCCFDEPISRALLKRRADSARQIIAELRALGITPVLPGYYGIVPSSFQQKHPAAHVIAQGDWNGFARPSWLDPRDPLFARVAATFYKKQRELFGNTTIYDMEMFQEGGAAGTVPIGEASQRVQAALEAAHPDAYWMLLGWQANPPAQLLQQVDRKRLLIVDIEQGRNPDNHRDQRFQGAAYLFGGLWDFGGRTTMGANLYDYAVRLPTLAGTASKPAGTAVFPEGMDNSPYVFDLFTEMAWHSEPIDLSAWTAQYATRRYGVDDPHAQRAWQILLSTAYGNRADGVSEHGERDAAQESLFDAQPSLTATRVSNWAPDIIRYQPEAFEEALVELLCVSPSARATETYHYDLVDVARQVMANRSRLLLPEINAAYRSRNERRFTELSDQWLHWMQLQNELLSTNQSFLLGPWLDRVRAWASSPGERALLDYDARSILTTWGDRTASEAGLHDYSNKDWAGLTSDLYEKRWSLYFANLRTALKTGNDPKPIDWFALSDAWNHEHQAYPTQPHGDSYASALRIARELHLFEAHPAK